MVKLQVLKIQSFYGAIACFILLQLFGFILFNAFTFYIESLFTIFWGFMWVGSLPKERTINLVFWFFVSGRIVFAIFSRTAKAGL